MKNPFDVGSRPGVFVGVVVVLLGLGAFYWLRTQNHRAELTQRNLRDLARIARGVEAKVNNLGEIVEGLAASGVDDGANGGVEAREASLERDLRRIPQSRNVFVFDGAGAESAGPPTTCNDASGVPSTGGMSLWIHANGTSACVGFRSSDRGGAPGGFVVEFDLVGLLRPAVGSGFFEEIFLVNEEGEVILQPDAAGQRLRRLPRATGEDSASIPSGNSTVYRAPVGGREHMVFLQPVDLQLPGPTSAGGNDQGGGTDRATRWRVGGLVDVARFRSEGLALDPADLSFLLLLVVFTVLAWPFLKLWSMGRQERVAPWDLLFLGFSLVFGSGIVAICVFEAAFLSRLEDRSDRQLREIGEEMAARVHTEVGLALEELAVLGREFDRGVREAGECPIDTSSGEEVYDCLARLEAEADAPGSGEPDTILDRPPYQRRCLLLGGSATEVSDTADRSGRCASEAADTSADSGVGGHFPYFDMAIWVNPRGFQVAKWSPNPDVTARRSVAHREYYQRVERGDLWRWSTEDPGDDTLQHEDDEEFEYFLEVIRSINTGEVLVALSKPFAPDSSGSGAEQASLPGRDGWAAVMITKLASLDRPVLPPGFGFAVVDSDGGVLFHSIPERALEANFFEETENDPGLRSAIDARVEGHRSLRYLGRDTRLFSTPIQDSPMSLIVFQDRAYPRTLAFETMAMALAFFGGFVVLLLIVAIIAHLLSRRLEWLWPDPEREDRYRVLLLIFGVLAAGSLLQAALAQDAMTVDRYLIHILTGPYLMGLLAVTATLIVLGDRSRLWLGAAGVTAAYWIWETGRHVEFDWLVVPGPLKLVLPLLSLPLTGWLLYRWWRERHEFARWMTGLPWLPERLYSATMLTGLLVVGTLPAALSFLLISADHVELLVKHTQLRAVEELDRRQVRIRSEYGPAGGARTVRRAGLNARLYGLEGGPEEEEARFPFDVLVTQAFRSCYWLPAGERASPDARWRCGHREDEGGQERPEAHDWASPVGSAHDLFLHRILEEHLPFFTDVSVQMRNLYHEHAASPGEVGPGESHRHAETAHQANRGWWWQIHRSHEDGEASTADEGDGEPLLLRVGPPKEDYEVFSRVPEGLGIPRGTWWWFGLLFGLVGLYLLIRFIARDVFLVDVDPPAAVSADDLVDDDLPDSTIVVTPWSLDRRTLREREDVEFVGPRELRRRAGLGDPDAGPEIDPRGRPGDGLLVIDGLDGVLEEGLPAIGLLEWIEELQCKERRIVLLVDRDPEEALGREPEPVPGSGTDEEGESDGDEGVRAGSSEHPGLRKRWARLLSHFTKLVAGRPRGNRVPGNLRGEAGPTHFPDRREATLEERNRRLLERECGITAALAPAAAHVRRNPDFGVLADDALTHLVRDAAAGQYRRIWNSLGHEENVVLAQIAYGAISMPKRRRTLARLESRGLVERRPDLHLMNRSFTHFVRDVVSARKLDEWERMAEESTWQALRRPLLVTLVAVAVFLFATQRDLFNTSIAFVTGLAAGMPALLRLLGTVRTGQESG